MSITVFYRGSMADTVRVEDFEDRIIDLALEMGGQAQIARHHDDDDPRRVVRGVLLSLAPGPETTRLLISPEGWLIGVAEIDDALAGRLTEPPWCFVKTQFGPLEGHVALVELLRELHVEFLPNLKVRDEAEYWESRDVERLCRSMSFVKFANDGLRQGLNEYRLSSEAVEDPNIVVARIERVADIVHRALSRPAEHAPVCFDDGDDSDDTEDQWDELYKANRRRQERLHLAIEERLGRGETPPHEVFENALRDEGIIDLPGEVDGSEAAHEFEASVYDEDEEHEPWRESLSEIALEEEEEQKHPLQQQSMDLMLRLHDLFKAETDERSTHLSVLHHGAGEIMGSLAQALGSWGVDVDSGLSLVQLKRALRGAAFAGGALWSLRSEGVIDGSVYDEFWETIQGLETEIREELRCARDWFRTD